MSSIDTRRDAPPGVTMAPRSTLERVWAVVPHLLVFAFLIAFPLVASSYQVGLMTQFLTFGLLAMSLDLLGDRAGLVSFGHGAWFGLGAYTLALTLERLPGAGGTYLGFLLAALVGGARRSS